MRHLVFVLRGFFAFVLFLVSTACVLADDSVGRSMTLELPMHQTNDKTLQVNVSVRSNALLPVPGVMVKNRQSALLALRTHTFTHSQDVSRSLNIYNDDGHFMVPVSQTPTMYALVVECIEGDEVVLETVAGRIRMPLTLLPEDARHEGAVMVLEHQFMLEQQRKNEGEARIARMKRISDAMIEI